MIYIAARSDGDDGGIYRYRSMGINTPELVDFTPLSHISYLAWSPDRRHLYAACEDRDHGAVATFGVSPEGRLKFLNRVSSHGHSSCHLTSDPAGKFLYSANYSSGNFVEFELDRGVIGRMRQSIQHAGSGPNPDRQEAAHVHFTGITPDGKFLAVVDLGLDRISCYRLSPHDGLLAAEETITPVTPGAGPRHLAFARDGIHAYLVNELNNTVCVLRYGEGRFEVLQTLPMLPEDFSGESKAAAIRLSPDGRFLIATNRDFSRAGSLAVYRVLADGMLEYSDLVSSGGVSPRDVNFLPGECWVAAANEYTNNVVFFGWNNGKLVKDCEVKHPNPLCILV